MDLLNQTHISLNASIPHNCYVSLGFGQTMFDTDMVIWQTNGNQSMVTDAYSYSHNVPTFDEIQDYETSFEAN
jgi:hypothetical protein